MSQTAAGPSRAKSAADWKKRKVHHDITLPSGTQVDIVLPSLAKLIKGGQLPNHLIESAIQQQSERKITREMLEQTWDFTRFIVPRTVVKPEITEDDVDELPVEDVEMIAAFASRNADMDAVGHHLAGLEAVQSFRDLRGIITTDEGLFDV